MGLRGVGLGMAPGGWRWDEFKATVFVPWLFVLFVCSVAAFFVDCLLLSDIFSLELKDSFCLIYRFIGRTKTAAAVFFLAMENCSCSFLFVNETIGFLHILSERSH